jgi:hypothetical protein
MRDVCGSRNPVRDDEYAFESLSAGEVHALSYVWQILSIETRVFGSVAILGLTGDFPDVWQVKDLGVGESEIGIRNGTELEDRRSCAATTIWKDSTA